MGHVSVGKLLIDRGASLEASPSPLIAALAHKHHQFVNLLLKRGADHSVLSPSNQNCMQIAALGENNDASSRKKMIKTLIHNGVSIDMPCDEFHHTVLHEAAQNGKHRCIPLLIELGANVNAQSTSGMTPVMLACRSNEILTAQKLLDSGRVDLECKSNDGTHILHEAVNQESEALVKRLVQKGAPLSLTGRGGITPFALALSKSNAAIVKILLEAGAAGVDGTAITNALENGNQDEVRLLINSGADVNRTNNRGDLPLSIACKHNQLLSASLLVKAGASINGSPEANEAPLTAAVYGGADDDLVEMLLDAGAYPDIVNSTGNTALHNATLNGRIGLTKLLLERGANPFIRNAALRTAQDIARDCGSTEISTLLEESMSSIFKKRPQHDKKPKESSLDGNGAEKVDEKLALIAGMEKLFLCPIKKEIMKDPVVASDGYSYEKSSIKQWLKTRGMSPVTFQQVSTKRLTPNQILKKQIEIYYHGGEGTLINRHGFQSIESIKTLCVFACLLAAGFILGLVFGKLRY